MSDELTQHGGEEDGDLLGTVGDASTVLITDYSEVRAVCRSVKKTSYSWGMRFKFTFSVYDPPKYQGATLPMYVRYVAAWKKRYVPESAKLYKAACITVGRRLPRGHQLTKSLWVGKAFRCRLGQVGLGAAMYTIIDMIIERETGNDG